MRLIVARCEVRYSGRLHAVLPEALRLLMLKADGSVMVHADTGGFKPQNWMTPPTVIEESEGLIVVRKRAGATEDRLDIKISEVISDVQKAGRQVDTIDAMATAGVLVSMLAHVAAHRYGFEFYGIRTAELERSMAHILYATVTGQKPPKVKAT